MIVWPSTAANAIEDATLVRVIDTTLWRRPSPDPSGISRVGTTSRFVVVDGEVEEIPSLWHHANMWFTRRSLQPLGSVSTRRFSDEPTDISMPSARLAYISDDNKKLIFRVTAGRDHRFGTADDRVTSFSTRRYRCTDPEGIAFAGSTLFIGDGDQNKICRVERGPDRRFGTRDDVLQTFDTVALGVRDPEGVTVMGDELFFIGRRDRLIVRTTWSGDLIATYSMETSGIMNPSGIAVSEQNGALLARVTERGVDNNDDPNENDGRIYIFDIG